MTRRDLHLLLLFFFLPALLFLYPALAGKTHFAGDVLYSFHPWLTYAAQEVQAGRLPLWNPYTACGEPFLGNPQIMIFHPAAVLFWLFPWAAARNVFLLSCQALLFAGVFLALRGWPDGPGKGRRGPALLAALAAAWSGFAVVHWEFASAGAALAWTPFFLLFALRRLWLFLALAAFMSFSAGYTQFTIYALLLSGLAAGFQPIPLRAKTAGAWSALVPRPSALVFWLLAAAGGAVLALPQILPPWEAARESLRSAMDAAGSRTHLLNPYFLTRFLIPEIFDKANVPYSRFVFDSGLWPIQRNWLTTFFLGSATAVLALSGLANARRRSVLFSAGAGLFFLALAMGWEPVFSLVRIGVPGARYMTHFSNAMLGVVLSLCFLAAEGLALLERDRRPFWAAWAAAALFCAAAAASSGLRRFLLEGLLSVSSLTPAQDGHAARAAAAALAALALAAAAAASPRRFRAPALALLVAAELWVFGRDLHPWTDGSFFHERVPLAEIVRESPFRLSHDPRRMKGDTPMSGDTVQEGYQSVRQTLRPNVHLPQRVPFTWGYEVFPLREFSEFRRAADISTTASPQMNFLAARHVVSSEPLPPPHRLLGRRPNALLWLNEDALPRVVWTERATAMPDKQERLAYLSSAWNPGQETVLEEAMPEGEARTVGESPELSWSEEPGRLRVRGRSAEEGFLSSGQVFYPGWEAFVNGRRSSLLRANHAFSAAETPAGQWEAVFLYRPALFRLGLWASLAFLAAAFFVLARRFAPAATRPAK
jgi:hypothetical protein